MTLKGLRAQAGLTIPQAAAQLGLSERQMYRLEHGKTPLRRLHILAMSVVYRVPADVVEAAGKETQ